MEGEKVKVKKWIITLDIIITLLATLIILYCVGNAFYSRVNKRIELVHVDKKILLKKLVNKEMIIVDESAPNEIRVYKNMNDVVIDKTNSVIKDEIKAALLSIVLFTLNLNKE